MVDPHILVCVPTSLTSASRLRFLGPDSELMMRDVCEFENGKIGAWKSFHDNKIERHLHMPQSPQSERGVKQLMGRISRLFGMCAYLLDEDGDEREPAAEKDANAVARELRMWGAGPCAIADEYPLTCVSALPNAECPLDG